MTNYKAVNSFSINSTGTNLVEILKYLKSPKVYFSSIGENGEIIETYELLYGCSNYGDLIITKFNYRNLPKSNNIINNSNFLEKIDFLKNDFSNREINLEIYLNKTLGKSREFLESKIKKIFAYNKVKISLNHKIYGKIYLYAVLDKIDFKNNIETDIDFANISLIGEPFWKKDEDIEVTGTINDSSGVIEQEIEGHRADFELEINNINGNASGVKISDLKIKEEINSGDIIEANFQTGIVKLNGNSEIEQIGTLKKLKNKIYIPITFLDKITYPPLNEILDSVAGVDGESRVRVQRQDYTLSRIRHYFDANNITNLKKIIIGGQNYYSAGVRIDIWIYDGDINNHGNTIFFDSIYLYAGKNVTNPEITINGDGLDVSSYNHLLIRVSVYQIGYVSSTDYIWDWYRTSTGTHGIGTSYDIDEDEVDWTRNLRLEGYSGSYENDKTIENISSFDYKLTYKNKYA